MTSLVRRNLIRGVPPILHSIDGVVGRFRSSASGGGALVFRGTIPGSLADVMNKKNRSCKFLANITRVVHSVLHMVLKLAIGILMLNALLMSVSGGNAGKVAVSIVIVGHEYDSKAYDKGANMQTAKMSTNH